MKKSTKEQVVAEFAAKLKAAPAAFLTDYRGLTVEQADDLRNKLRETGVEYSVVKNTLLRLASQGTDMECLSEHLSGPTSVTITGDDPVAPAKVLADFAKANEVFEIKCGVLNGVLLSVAEINALAALPSRDELLAKMLSSINAPVSNFVGVLAAIPRSLVQVLGAIQEQKAA